jgi:dTMP kinase
VPSERIYAGHLIAFEGPDELRRTEAIEQVRAALQARGKSVLVSRPLGPTLAGEIYQEAKLFNELSPRTLVLLTASDVSERLEWEILPALDDGKVILADRYVHRVVQGLARDLDPAWMEVLNAFAPVPDAVFHFARPAEELAANLKLSSLDLYDAGMDIGITRDVPLSYQLYQERVDQEYDRWSTEHGVDLLRDLSLHEIVARVEELLGLDARDLDLRRHGVLELMRDSDPDPMHAMHVSELAGSLFDQTRPLHNLGPSERELLEHAMLLNYVGAGVDSRNHHVRVAKTIRESALPGFTAIELEELAILAASVSVGDARELDAWMLGLPEEARSKVRLLAPLARLSDSFNASRLYTVRWIAVTVTEEACALKIQSRNKAKPELRAIREHADLFQQVYGRAIVASAERQGPPPANVDLGPAMPHSFCPIYR